MSLRATRGIPWNRVQAAVVVVAIAAAYHYSLLTLVRQLSLGTLVAGVGLVPGVVLVVAAVRAATAEGGPAIEDRTVDFIVGLPPLLAALAVMLVLPVSLSTFFWLWRLDLLTLPFFAAGAVSLVCGVRTLWRLRIQLAFLFLAWPLPYLQSADRLARFGTVATAALRRLVAAIPPAHSVRAGAGSVFLVSHQAHRFPLTVPSGDTGVTAILGFLLASCALATVLRGALPIRLLWLATGTALTWALNLLWVLVALAAGVSWGENAGVRWLQPSGSLVVSGLAILVMIAALPLFRLRFGAPVSPPYRPARAPRRAPGRLVGACLVLALITGLGAVADDMLRSFEPVARDLGAPQVSAIGRQNAAVPGWSLSPTGSIPWAWRYFGPGSTWTRYTYNPAPGTAASSAHGPVAMDVFTTPDLASLRAYGIEATYRFYHYELVETTSVDLGAGVTGHMAVYGHKTGNPWIGIYWEWPVETSRGPRYERVVLHLDDPGGAYRAVRVDQWRPCLVRSAQLLLNDSLGSSQGGPATGALKQPQEFLVGFASRVVSADASASDGHGTPKAPYRARSC